jgi:YVTN family beta-propeller protein
MAVISPDFRSVVVTGQGTNKIYIIDTESMKVRASFNGHGEPSHMVITPNSKYAFIGNMHTGIVAVVDIPAGVEAKAMEGFNEPHNFEVTPDGSKVYVANFGAHEVTVIDVGRLEIVKRISVGAMNEATTLNTDQYLGNVEGVPAPTMSLDGKYLFAADTDLGIMAVIETKTDKVIKSIPLDGKPWKAYPSSDGKYMVVAINESNEIAVVEVASQKLVAKMPSGGDITGVNFVNGGKKAYVLSSTEGMVYAYNLESMEPAGKILLDQTVELATATTDVEGRKIYVCGTNNDTIYVIEGATDKVSTIKNVGNFPWGTHLMGSTDNYCH